VKFALAGGLLSHRHNSSLKRRLVVYFCSAAYTFFLALAHSVENGADRIRTSLLTSALFRLRTLN
jgi:hypothetical protein